MQRGNTGTPGCEEWGQTPRFCWLYKQKVSPPEMRPAGHLTGGPRHNQPATRQLGAGCWVPSARGANTGQTDGLCLIHVQQKSTEVGARTAEPALMVHMATRRKSALSVTHVRRACSGRIEGFASLGVQASVDRGGWSSNSDRCRVAHCCRPTGQVVRRAHEGHQGCLASVAHLDWRRGTDLPPPRSTAFLRYSGTHSQGASSMTQFQTSQPTQ